MYYLKTESHFDAAHFLKDYQGKCRNIHGHRWRIVASFYGEQLSDDVQTRGMLYDFGEIKKALNQLCDHLDHTFIYETNSLKQETIQALNNEQFVLREVPFRPTAENFAKYFFEQLKIKYPVKSVDVYETPTNLATYEE